VKNEKELIASKSAFPLIPLIILLIGIYELFLTCLGVLGGSDVPSPADDPPVPFILLGLALIAVAALIYFNVANCLLRVTDKRVYGKGAFGKRVDIPIDSVSSVGKISWLKGVIVSSSSGSIRFMYLANADEIHTVLSDLIISRQGKNTNTIIKQEVPQSNADELKKYKELLDSEIITQEEFDEKKKQLLGL